MAQVRGLGYIVVDATDIEAWRRFGTEALGMMDVPVTDDGALHLKMDDRPFRLRVQPGETDRLARSGWELTDDVQFGAALDELRAAGHTVTEATSEELQARQVNGLARLTDPGGAEIELFYGPVFDHRIFMSPAGVSGFVTGQLGMGHIVMVTPAADETYRFYTEELGFRLSDVMRLGGTTLRFTHCNPRHHSLAFAAGPKLMMQHFMVEVASLDDVGYGYDRFQDLGVRIRQTIGKHTNDHMVSFYAQTPGPFFVEFGFGGIKVDDATWTTGEITATSFWGHRRPPKPAAAAPALSESSA